MADYSKLMSLEKKPKEQPLPSPAQKEASQPNNNQPTAQPTKQSTDKSTGRLANTSINHSISHANKNKVMDKPRGFYITEGLNQRIDQAVRYYQEQHNLKKVDRSIVVTTLLDNETNWTEETLDLLVDKVISQLTYRLTNR